METFQKLYVFLIVESFLAVLEDIYEHPLPHANTVSWALTKNHQSKFVWLVAWIKVLRVKGVRVGEVVLAGCQVTAIDMNKPAFGNNKFTVRNFVVPDAVPLMGYDRRLKSQGFIDDLFHVFQLLDSFKGKLAICPTHYLVNLLNHLVLDLLVVYNLVGDKGHSSRGCLEARKEEKDRICHQERFHVKAIVVICVFEVACVNSSILFKLSLKRSSCWLCLGRKRVRCVDNHVDEVIPPLSSLLAHNEWLLNATSGCEQRVVAGTFGAGVF